MDPKSDEEDHKQEDNTRPDSKFLVAALTQQLNQSHIDEAPQAQARAHAGIATTASLVTMASDTNNTGNSSSTTVPNNFYDHVEESFPLPDFLSETHLRAALHHAVNAQSQEAISDEAPPYSNFPHLRPVS